MAMVSIGVMGIVLGLVFWAGVFLTIRGFISAKKTGHEASIAKAHAEITRLKAEQAGVQPAAPAPAPKAGPSKAATAAKAVGKAAAWTAPRLVAGTAVVSKASVKGAKATIVQVSKWKKAKAAAKAPVQPAETPASGGNVLTPEQEKTMTETPAFMRAGKVINLAEQRDSRHTLH
ncbi:hypothetical protein [Acidithiobacillus thiooxidans]|uniref:Uncharacterized protein n=1 Tax=Acidithiobacillus thiooxidans ATCC 19377 TaxID=637390 RepID=A0A543Q271_ACITH|nr:hypothetical protein [Acidithiobacillus thiooxidans]MDX5935480.1 hypothetical protein [Acidithiobacillus thiooxidans]TQN50380.1 hypothetical protein DLNHIDIE_00233 [Acidithiobacillus thiooxidans ATCC 19377]